LIDIYQISSSIYDSS